MARRFGLAVFLATAGAVALASSAQAATTIGQSGTPTACSGPDYGGQVQVGTGGISYTVPFNGTITSWSAASDVSGPTVQTKLLILQPVSGHTFHVVDKSALGTFTTTGVQTFSAQIPVHQGQVIGDFGQLCYIATGNSGNQDAAFNGPEPAIGTDQDFGSGGPPGNAVDLSATVEASNTFSLGAVSRNQKKGTATLTVNDIPNPGDLTGSGNGAKVASGATTSKAVTPPGPAKLTIRAKGKKKRTLNDTGKVKLKIAITYTPTGGSPNTKSVKVKLKKKL